MTGGALPLTSRDLLRWAAERYGERDALVFGDRPVSFTGLLDAACRLASGLGGKGVRPGDRVGRWRQAPAATSS